jgi:hypothetical protein
MAAFGVISHAGLHVEALSFPWLLAAGITTADVGKLVTIDTGAAHTVKLAAADEVVVGVLQTVENRLQEGILTGAVEHRGGFKVKTTGTIAVGDKLVGSATAGVGKTATDDYDSRVIVTAVLADDWAEIIMV